MTTTPEEFEEEDASNVTELPVRGPREVRVPRGRVRMSGQERREQLLDVGRRLFADKGFEAVSVEEIASKAGVSKPVVYEHFGGKEGLYAVVVDREMTYLLLSISEALGDVDDPTGNFFYAYPALAVNASNDVLLGYSRFSATQYASAAYAFRFGVDPAHRLRADTILKAGVGPYYSPANGLNRWGDYSAACVDPTDDFSLWTIQEYAAAGNFWGTWWGRINPDPALLKLALTRPADGFSYPSNPVITLEATALQSNLTFIALQFFADNTLIGATNTAPFRIQWTGATAGDHELFAIGTDNLGGKATTSVITVTVGDPTSPVGTWETKLSGAAKGTAILTFHDDFTVTGHGMTAGTLGLFPITGAWTVNADHQPTGTLAGFGNFFGKVNGPKFSATATDGLAAWKFKGTPLAPVPNLAGSWTATVDSTTAEQWQLTASPDFANVFDWLITGPAYSASGSMLITAKGAINASVTNAPQQIGRAHV